MKYNFRSPKNERKQEQKVKICATCLKAFKPESTYDRFCSLCKARQRRY